jgi:hypothetical protein
VLTLLRSGLPGASAWVAQACVDGKNTTGARREYPVYVLQTIV